MLVRGSTCRVLPTGLNCQLTRAWRGRFRTPVQTPFVPLRYGRQILFPKMHPGRQCPCWRMATTSAQQTVRPCDSAAHSIRCTALVQDSLRVWGKNYGYKSKKKNTRSISPWCTKENIIIIWLLVILQTAFDPAQRRQVSNLSSRYIREFFRHNHVVGIVSQLEMSVATPDSVAINIDQQIFFQLILIEIGSQRKFRCFRVFDEQTSEYLRNIKKYLHNM